MAPENHLEWECCFLTCLTLNKLRCEEQASFIKRWAHFDTNAHTKGFKHQNSVLLYYALTNKTSFEALYLLLTAVRKLCIMVNNAPLSLE